VIVPTDLPPAPYICPMCEDVRSDKPGACPQCGMALEKIPLARRNEPECCGDGGDEEVRDLWWRVRWSAAMTVPVVLLSMGMDLPVIRDISHDASGWMQFVWATPVVFWVGWPLLARFGQIVAHAALQHVHAHRPRCAGGLALQRCGAGGAELAAA
jgi:Cu+-exporting ATPase